MIVRAGILYDGSLDAPRKNVDLLIEDGVVREFRDAGGKCDYEAACVTPGLVNAHAHLEMSGEPDPMSAILAMPPLERMLHAVENAQKSLRAGVTTIREPGGSEAIAIRIRR